jgi:hypothetical protein
LPNGKRERNPFDYSQLTNTQHHLAAASMSIKRLYIYIRSQEPAKGEDYIVMSAALIFSMAKGIASGDPSRYTHTSIHPKWNLGSLL